MSLEFAKEHGLVVQRGKQVARVRLANGKVVETVGVVQVTIIFGSYHFIGRFQLLDCAVPLILGMEFLQKVQPRVDFAKKQVAVVHKGLRYQLPTCVISNDSSSRRGNELVCQKGTEQHFQCSSNVVLNDRSFGKCCVGSSCLDGKCSCAQKESCGGATKVAEGKVKGLVASIRSKELKSALQRNSFWGLQVEEAGEEPAHTIRQNVGSCPQQVLGVQKRAKRGQHRCVQCGEVFYGSGQYCQQCDDVVVAKYSNFEAKQQQELDIQVLSYKTFARRGRRRQFDFVGVLQLECERGCEDFGEVLNFTHRSTLGGGDDADESQGSMGNLASKQMAKLKSKYPQVFEEPVYPVDRSSCPQQFEHSIPLIDESAAPPKRKLYPLDSRELSELKEQLKNFLESGRIEVANGAYGAPILFAKKKDGGLRMCIDYRALNGQTRSDVYPLPRIDELLQRLDGACVFSKFDMRDGYHQIPMRVSDKVKTSFTCRYGTYQFTVMPFGLTSAPSTFQRVMNNIFFDLLDRGVLVYLDDVLVYSKTTQEHVQLLDQVFSLFAKYKLYLKESKCSLFMEKVNFLGHVVSAKGIELESGKVEVVQKWPTPTTVTHVQQFLGLCNYYRRFIVRFSEVAGPLTLLTKKDQAFVWGQAQQKAFENLKQLLCCAPVLKVFDSTLDTRVVCDASNFCVGGVLEQRCSDSDKWHPVEYYSKRLSSSERNYSATDREYVAIRQCLERWRHFLVGIKFVILTDHVALTYIQSSATVSRRNARWLEFLSQFDFEIEHIKGKENVVADTLSRIPGSEQLGALLYGFYYTLGVEHVDDGCADVDFDLQCSGVLTLYENQSFLEQLEREQKACKGKWFQNIVVQAQKGSQVYVYRSGILCKLVKDHFCPVLPDNKSSTVQVLLHDLHSSALGGHLGYRKLLQIVQSRFYFQAMQKTVETFVKNCSVCQANKHSTQKPPGLLQPVENPQVPFEHVTMDFIMSLPTSTRGNDAIFSIVDRFSRVCCFIPCKTTVTALDVANIFFERWICKYGVPKKIISDRDVRFTSQFWDQLFRLLGSRVALSTAYHPQTDGLTERFHRSIEQVLRCYCSGAQEQWDARLAQCEFALNSTFQTAISDVPFRVVYGLAPSIPLDVSLASVQLPAVQDFVQTRLEVQKRVLGSLKESQDRMAGLANRHRRDLSFEVGQQVWLSTKYLPLKVLSRKLAALWAGPYEVIGKVGNVAYKLLIPSTWNIHDVFHVSQLKQVVGYVQVEQGIQVDGHEEFEVEKILQSRVARGQKQYLCKWKGYGDFENSWVNESDMGNARQLVRQFERSLSLSGQPRTRRGSGVRA